MRLLSLSFALFLSLFFSLSLCFFPWLVLLLSLGVHSALSLAPPVHRTHTHTHEHACEYIHTFLHKTHSSLLSHILFPIFSLCQPLSLPPFPFVSPPSIVVSQRGSLSDKQPEQTWHLHLTRPKLGVSNGRGHGAHWLIALNNEAGVGPLLGGQVGKSYPHPQWSTEGRGVTTKG